MKTKHGLVGVIILVSIFFLSVSFISIDQDKKWVAPKSADKIKNPIKSDANSVKSGKKIYKAMCAICHGFKGKGDGMAASGLNPKAANFTIKEFHSQTDGAIFWKLSEGRSPMAGYKSSLSEKQRWQIVNYLRTLKK